MEAVDFGAKYLADSMKTEQNVRDYLERKEFSEKEINEAIASLKECNYLNDVEYAKVAFRLEYEKGRGKMRIERHLAKKGVSKEDIEKGYFEFIDSDDGKGIDEKKIALEVANKIAKDKDLDDKLRAKIARNLTNRGFTTNTVYFAINNIEKEK